jgi:hypothetical protein
VLALSNSFVTLPASIVNHPFSDLPESPQIGLTCPVAFPFFTPFRDKEKDDIPYFSTGGFRKQSPC